jgi:hypothetical protein
MDRQSEPQRIFPRAAAMHPNHHQNGGHAATRRFAQRFERPPDATIARALYKPLLMDVRASIGLALRVAVLAEEGCSRQEIAERTGADSAQLRDAFERLERVGHRPR